MGIGIHCCKDCVPPKRHGGCHATCKEYKDEKAQYEEDKRKLKENQPPSMSQFDFDKISFASGGMSKRRKR